MPSVYRVLRDAEYQYLESVDTDRWLSERKASWRFDGTPVGDTWTPLEMYVREPLLKKPDIWACSDALIFEPHAVDVLQTFLDQSGEQFALPFEDRVLTVLNVTYVLNCLNKEKSDYDLELPHIIDDYAFFADRLDYSLFKIPETRHSQILVVEGLAAPGDEFKAIVESYGFAGLRFDRLWSSD